ncbi:hypothetical protein [Novosphingobium lindaniclasticum]
MISRRFERVALSVNAAFALFCLAGATNLLWLAGHRGNAPEHELVAGLALLTMLWLANAARLVCPLHRRALPQALLNGAALLLGVLGLLLGFADPVAWLAPIVTLPPALTYLWARHARAS